MQKYYISRNPASEWDKLRHFVTSDEKFLSLIH